ncbi:MAG: CHAD domain-containing protein [Bacteroidetes bacterium]|nr:CHAD domain-containing protein [Bacteroidota bacterium]NWJ53368.1 CHAD domain-containing protein [Bacteroidota bacterium]
MTDHLKQYFNKQYLRFANLYKECQENYDIEVVHDMRLCMKKIKAFLLFIETIEPNSISAKTLLLNFKKLYKKAGAIRDIQMQKVIALQFEKELDSAFIDYINYLNKKEKKAIKTFGNKKSIYDPEQDYSHLKEKINKVLDKQSEDDFLKIGESCFLKKHEELKKLIKGKLTTKRMHTVRIKLKQFSYMLKLWQSKESDRNIFPFERTELQEIESKLGSWHDLVVAQTLLYNFFDTAPNEEAISLHYALLALKIRNNRALMLKEIKPLLKQVFNREIVSL